MTACRRRAAVGDVTPALGRGKAPLPELLAPAAGPVTDGDAAFVGDRAARYDSMALTLKDLPAPLLPQATMRTASRGDDASTLRTARS